MSSDLQAKLVALRRAYATGMLRVRFRDEEVYYASGDDLLRRIRTLERQLSPATRRTVGVFRNGT